MYRRGQECAPANSYPGNKLIQQTKLDVLFSLVSLLLPDDDIIVPLCFRSRS